MVEIGYVNGQFGPLAEATIPINDRGFLFGDGVYEVLRGYDGRLWAEERHWRRLAWSLAELGLEGVDLDSLRSIMHEAVRRAQTSEPLVYLQITRGIAPRSHGWDDAELHPTIVVTVRQARDPAAASREQGVACLSLPDERWHRCDVKSVNLLANVLAKQRAKRAGATEAILYDGDGQVTEGSSSAVLAVFDGALWCPPQSPALLPSITRDIALELAAELGLDVRREGFSLDALRAADEAMICSTTSEVLGVTRLDDEPLGRGGVGPVTRQLARAYRAAVAAGRDSLPLGAAS